MLIQTHRGIRRWARTTSNSTSSLLNYLFNRVEEGTGEREGDEGVGHGERGTSLYDSLQSLSFKSYGITKIHFHIITVFKYIHVKGEITTLGFSAFILKL